MLLQSLLSSYAGRVDSLGALDSLVNTMHSSAIALQKVSQEPLTFGGNCHSLPRWSTAIYKGSAQMACHCVFSAVLSEPEQWKFSCYSRCRCPLCSLKAQNSWSISKKRETEERFWGDLTEVYAVLRRADTGERGRFFLCSTLKNIGPLAWQNRKRVVLISLSFLCWLWELFFVKQWDYCFAKGLTLGIIIWSSGTTCIWADDVMEKVFTWVSDSTSRLKRNFLQ